MQQYHAAKASDNNAIYRVVNNRNRNVAKSEAAMQTEAGSAINLQQQQQQRGRQIQTAAAVDWKQAMAHNARVLSSQEKAMDEYLKRQRAAAEHHIAAANSQLQIQQQRHQVDMSYRMPGRMRSGNATEFTRLVSQPDS